VRVKSNGFCTHPSNSFRVKGWPLLMFFAHQPDEPNFMGSCIFYLQLILGTSLLNIHLFSYWFQKKEKKGFNSFKFNLPEFQQLRNKSAKYVLYCACVIVIQWVSILNKYHYIFLSFWLDLLQIILCPTSIIRMVCVCVYGIYLF
jgi:hypothetical protein